MGMAGFIKSEGLYFQPNVDVTVIFNVPILTGRGSAAEPASAVFWHPFSWIDLGTHDFDGQELGQ